MFYYLANLLHTIKVFRRKLDERTAMKNSCHFHPHCVDFNRYPRCTLVILFNSLQTFAFASVYIKRLFLKLKKCFILCPLNALWSQFHEHFTHTFFVQKALSSFSLLRVWLWTNFCTKNSCLKCCWNWQLVSISPTFYEQLFRL